MLVITLVLSAFLSGLFTAFFIEYRKDMWALVFLAILVMATIFLTILTYAEAYSF